MRGLTPIFAVIALAPLAGGAVAISAHAADQTVVISNWTNDPAYFSASAADWYSPIATTGGALWINTGGGPVLYNLNADVNIQLNVEAPGGWTTVATLLLGNGTAKGDITGEASGYPGMFWASNSQSPAAIPGTNAATGPYPDFNVEIYFWTGNYSTYAAAEAAAAGTPGVYTADSGIFNQYVPFGPTIVPEPLLDMSAVVLSQHPVALPPGDANGDGRVDINDLTIVLSNFGQSVGPGAWANGEFTGDGTVNVNDLTIVLSNFGHGTSAGAAAAVPEPASAVLLACCGLATVLVYWASQRRSRALRSSMRAVLCCCPARTRARR